MKHGLIITPTLCYLRFNNYNKVKENKLKKQKKNLPNYQDFTPDYARTKYRQDQIKEIKLTCDKNI